ncbi:glycosyltransferase family 9 protein [Fulvivirga sp. M361]|uniref:glycosyltransferase family 9 protein n=1 Tax=Fulvivirga sp. M361 TaxID=2594266 RepID=UPI00117B2043|nr:glycosyltransferase family 9 protein [Fulvivirga sp. M361]TRX60869.1 glycosyltransferase family 9 protein [Fulvivirga sp. M361]
MSRPLNKILVIQTAFLGDVILGTSLLESLRVSYPNAELHYLVRKGNETVLKNHPFLKVWVFDKKNKIRNLIRIILSLRKEKFDLVINLQRFFTSGVITVLSGARQTRGFQKNPLSRLFNYTFIHKIDADSPVHEVERNYQLIGDLSPSKKSARPRLYPLPNHYDEVRKYKENRFICIAPASVWHTKQWPVSKWVELIDAIPDDFDIYLLGAPGDSTICEQIQSDAQNEKRVTVLAGKLSPLASCALMQDAAMNYVNDSAPLHFASAMNAAVTAVFCSTVPGFGFTPLSEDASIVEVREPLSCRPCGLHGHQKCPEGHFKCALSISIEPLLESIS